MHPAEQSELRFEILSLQRGNEANKTDHVQGKTGESMIRCKKGEVPVGEDDMLHCLGTEFKPTHETNK